MTNLKFILQPVLIVTNLKCIKEYKIKILSQTHPTLGSPEVSLARFAEYSSQNGHHSTCVVMPLALAT